MVKVNKRVILLMLLALVLLSSAGYLLSKRRTANKIIFKNDEIKLEASLGNIASDNSDLDLDFDSIEDIRFYRSIGSGVFFVFQPLYNSASFPFGVDEPGYVGCSNDMNNFTQGGLPEVFEGNYICVLTSKKNIAQILIKDINHESPEKIVLTLEILVWDTISRN